MFDKITVSRNMKELTNLSKQFGKVASEANSLQERMSVLYEDMGNILGRYYTIGEAHVYGHDDEDRDMNRDDLGEADKMMFREEDDYKAFFKKAMKTPKGVYPSIKKNPDTCQGFCVSAIIAEMVFS